MSCTFERARRIVKTDEFSSVFRLRPLFKTEHLVLYARPNAMTHARLGVVAAKRFAPRAVTRNAVKRAVREGFRLSDTLRTTGLDCVVRLSKPLVTKQQPACTAALQALLFHEVLSLFAISSKFKKVVEANAKESTKGSTE
jgi:ribonuclease P protein component